MFIFYILYIYNNVIYLLILFLQKIVKDYCKTKVYLFICLGYSHNVHPTAAYFAFSIVVRSIHVNIIFNLILAFNYQCPLGFLDVLMSCIGPEYRISSVSSADEGINAIESEDLTFPRGLFSCLLPIFVD